MAKSALHLFEGYGIELEYMIVDAETLDVRPICDRLLEKAGGEIVSEIEMGALSWSNELALHVVELKTNGPAGSLEPLAAQFQQDVRRINEMLRTLGAKLMPTAMHPWMNPFQEMRLWPHEYSPVYEAYDRIFNCKGHGWANLQSVHINLPFANDDEFARLHAAIRLVLPLLPALAASSPIVDGHMTGLLDNRLDVYRKNSARVPLVAGRVIPEPAYSEADYRRQILEPLYAAIAPLDPRKVLQDEFLNARGAIARFSRKTIEIRLLDIQECPAADLAICAGVIAVVRALVDEQLSTLTTQQSLDVESLVRVLSATIKEAECAVIDDAGYLSALGLGVEPLAAGEVWQRLLERTGTSEKLPADAAAILQRIAGEGTLARRIVGAVGEDCAPSRLRAVYGELCHCLAEGEMFVPESPQGTVP